MGWSGWTSRPGTIRRTHALTNVFGFHPLAIRDSINRNQVPKVHRYPDHFFVVLHAPQPGAHGHVHYVELDQFIGGRYLVTVHGPVNPAIDPSTAMVEVNAVLGRLESGKLLPGTGFELSFKLLAALTARMRNIHRRVDQGRLEARAASHRWPPRRPGSVSRRDVPGPARSAHGRHDGGVEPRGVRPDGHHRGLRRRQGAGSPARRGRSVPAPDA